MKKLPLPKETRKPWTTWQQLRFGLVFFLVGMILGDILDNPLFLVLGIWGYAGSFSIFPIVPEHLKDKPTVAKKFVRNLRLLAAGMILLSLTKLTPQ